MTGDQPRSRVRSQLQKQAEEILTQESQAVDLVCQLDYGYLQHNDQYAEWHAASDLLPMVRALFLKELEGHSFSELHRYLNNESGVAERLGFEEVPSRTTFGRAWRDRLTKEVRQSLRHNAEMIRELAQERGSSIGADALDPEDKDGVSRRTEDRYIAKKTKEVTQELRRLIFRCFPSSGLTTPTTMMTPSSSYRAIWPVSIRCRVRFGPLRRRYGSTGRRARRRYAPPQHQATQPRADSEHVGGGNRPDGTSGKTPLPVRPAC